MKPKVAHLRITTWAGVGIGAIHYYGKLIYGKDREEIEVRRVLTKEDAKELNVEDDLRPGRVGNPYVEGDHTGRFYSEESCIETGIEMFKAQLEPKGYNALILGDSFTISPEPMIAGDKDLMNQANRICFEFEDLGAWECDKEDEPYIEELSAKWEKLMAEFKIPKRFNLIFGFKDGSKKSWPEEYSSIDLEKWDCKTPHQLGKVLVEFFNGSLRPNEKERVFLGVEK